MATPAENVPAVEPVEQQPGVMSAADAMSKIRLIAIAGVAGAGKDTLADYIVSAFGATKRAIADPIKANLNAIFGFPASAWDDRRWKETPLPMIGHSPRVLAQSLGAWGRSVNEDLWIAKLITRWREAEGALFVVPDVRLDNEAVYAIRSGALVIKVERSDAKPVSPDATEQGVQDQLVHHTIYNDGSIEELHEAFDRMIVKHVLEIEAAMEKQAGANG